MKKLGPGHWMIGEGETSTHLTVERSERTGEVTLALTWREHVFRMPVRWLREILRECDLADKKDLS